MCARPSKDVFGGLRMNVPLALVASDFGRTGKLGCGGGLRDGGGYASTESSEDGRPESEVFGER